MTMQAETMTEELYDFKQLEEIAAGNQDFIKALARIFIDTIPPSSTELVNATRSGDWQHASKLAHKLKSTVDSMNIVSIKTDIRTIEMDAKKKLNTAALCNLALKVDEILHLVAEDLRLKFDF